MAAFVARRCTREPEAGGAVERGEIDIGRKARGLAEHHVARDGIADGVRSCKWSADDQIGEAVAVDVARGGNRKAAEIIFRVAREPEAGRAVEYGEVDVGRKQPEVEGLIGKLERLDTG